MGLSLLQRVEPCAHYGKTPPCAELIIKKGVRRVVVGCVDPFAQVQGRGIAMIRKAGIEVTVGVLEQECQWLNRRFFTYHAKHRPYIILKWAQTANGFIDDHGRALQISNEHTQMLSHQLRAEEDAILVGHTTDAREHVEGGRQTHESFISSGLWDEIRVETAPFVVSGGTRAPQLPTDILLYNKVDYNGNTITAIGVSVTNVRHEQ